MQRMTVIPCRPRYAVRSVSRFPSPGLTATLSQREREFWGNRRWKNSLDQRPKVYGDDNTLYLYD